MLRQDLKHKFMGLNGKYVCAFEFDAPQRKFPVDTYHNCENVFDVYLLLSAAIVDFSAELGASPFDILGLIAGDIKHLENNHALEGYPYLLEGYPYLKNRKEDTK